MVIATSWFPKRSAFEARRTKMPVHFYGYCIFTGLACQNTGQLVTYTDVKCVTRFSFDLFSNDTSHNCSRCQNFSSGNSFKRGKVSAGDIGFKTEEARRKCEPTLSCRVACMTQFSRKLIAGSVYLCGMKINLKLNASTQPYAIRCLYILLRQ